MVQMAEHVSASIKSAKILSFYHHFLFCFIYSRTFSPKFEAQNMHHTASSYASFLHHHVSFVGLPCDLAKNCEICWEDYSKNDPALQLIGCKHIFGRRCLGLWVHDHNTCPKCRAKLYSGETPAESLATTWSTHQSDQDFEDIISRYLYRDDAVDPMNAQTTDSTPTMSVRRLEQILPTNGAPVSSPKSDYDLSQMIQHSGSSNDIFQNVSGPAYPTPMPQAPASYSGVSLNNYQKSPYQIIPTSNLRNTPHPRPSQPTTRYPASRVSSHRASRPQNRPRSNAMTAHYPHPHSPATTYRTQAPPSSNWRHHQTTTDETTTSTKNLSKLVGPYRPR
jgi:hypothetical protein